MEARLNELEQRRERDLVLAPNEFAYIMDETKGNVDILSGPNKTSLSATDKPVILDYKTKRFVQCSLDKSIQLKIAAPEGWYVILKNPSSNSEKKYPSDGTNTVPDLNVGRKVNISGPCAFALWPGQMAKVVKGHSLKNNQYLIIRVYDEEIAKENWKQAVAVGSDDNGDKKNIVTDLIKTEDLKMGNLLIIKGTDVSFFIPPSGVEIHSDTSGEFVREAVTLEQIEYCQLTDQNGTKRYERGPKVVFPNPTERFVTAKQEGQGKPSRKFRAIELNPNSGIYIKIIADYFDNEEEENEHFAGEELFITGNDQPIYFPREEHAVIKYGDGGEEQEIHYGIAIPKGEARYVMNRNTGAILLAKGPQVFLPDPRKEVIIRRVLDAKTCELMFPLNMEALEYNNALIDTEGDLDLAIPAAAALYSKSITDDGIRGMDNSHRHFARSAARSFGGDSFKRNSEYTKPRSITLNTKYDGAVTVAPYTGYAIMVVDKSGNRRVVEGPQTVLLEYDETLQVMEFSTGIPKHDSITEKSVYLRVMNNKVSDIFSAKTRDFCDVDIPISFRVNFDSNHKEKWFNIENYIKLLTENMRSKIRNVIMRLTIEDFYKNSTDILRDTILGKRVISEDGETKSRPGFLFEENAMFIYNIDVLEITLRNKDIQQLLTTSERDVIKNNLNITAEERRLIYIQKTENINQNISKAQAETRRVKSNIQNEDIVEELKTAVAKIDSKKKQELTAQDAILSVQETLNSISEAKLSRVAATEDQEIIFSKKRLDVRTEELKSQVEASVIQGKVFTPDLVAALQRFGDDKLLETAVEALGPLGVMKLAGGSSIADVLHSIFKGTALEKALPEALGGNSNGKIKHSAPPLAE